jgi:hypothetical protein
MPARLNRRTANKNVTNRTESSMQPKTTAYASSRANSTTSRFKKGDSKPQGSGRKRGTPNRMSGTLKEAIIAAANSVGEKKLNDKTGKHEPGDGGLTGYLLHLALHNESAFCALLARVLPLHKVEEKPKRTYPTEEEVRALCVGVRCPALQGRRRVARIRPWLLKRIVASEESGLDL